MITETLIKNDEIIIDGIKTLIQEGKTVEITIKGNSMNPFMVHLRDQIVLGPWEDKQIRRGAVVLVKDTRGKWLIHRIIKRTGKTIILEGDGNIGIKEKADVSNIVGLMHAIKRKGRTYASSNLIWKIYSWFWMILCPVRTYPIAFWRKYLAK